MVDKINRLRKQYKNLAEMRGQPSQDKINVFAKEIAKSAAAAPQQPDKVGLLTKGRTTTTTEFPWYKDKTNKFTHIFCKSGMFHVFLHLVKHS